MLPNQGETIIILLAVVVGRRIWNCRWIILCLLSVTKWRYST